MTTNWTPELMEAYSEDYEDMRKAQAEDAQADEDAQVWQAYIQSL